jgi:hypothetical protein
MKRFRLAALLGLLVVSGGCESTLDPAHGGIMRGMLGPHPWAGTAHVAVSGDTVFLYSQRQNTSEEQSLVIVAVRTSPDAYAVITESMSPRYASSYWETVGGDVAHYHALAQSGTIRFSRLDRQKWHAAGTVEITLEGERGTLRFIRGEFDARSVPIMD